MSSIRSVIISVIRQIGLPLRVRLILFITRMITDRIGLNTSPITIMNFLLQNYPYSCGVCRGFHILTFDLGKVTIVLILNETKETTQSSVFFFKLTSDGDGGQYFVIESTFNTLFVEN